MSVWVLVAAFVANGQMHTQDMQVYQHQDACMAQRQTTIDELATVQANAYQAHLEGRISDELYAKIAAMPLDETIVTCVERTIQ